MHGGTKRMSGRTDASVTVLPKAGQAWIDPAAILAASQSAKDFIDGEIEEINIGKPTGRRSCPDAVWAMFVRSNVQTSVCDAHALPRLAHGRFLIAFSRRPMRQDVRDGLLTNFHQHSNVKIKRDCIGASVNAKAVPTYQTRAQLGARETPEGVAVVKVLSTSRLVVNAPLARRAPKLLA